MAQVNQSNLYITGIPFRKDACIVIVRTEWNAAIVDELEKGVMNILAAQKIQSVHTVTVPGAFEIPFAIKSQKEKETTCFYCLRHHYKRRYSSF
jgi:6,7-dimethyl-8-ribityllumazine synthase